MSYRIFFFFFLRKLLEGSFMKTDGGTERGAYTKWPIYEVVKNRDKMKWTNGQEMA